MPFFGPSHAHGRDRTAKRKAARTAKQQSTGNSVWTTIKGKASTWASEPPDSSVRTKQISPGPVLHMQPKAFRLDGFTEQRIDALEKAATKRRRVRKGLTSKGKSG